MVRGSVVVDTGVPLSQSQRLTPSPSGAHDFVVRGVSVHGHHGVIISVHPGATPQ